MDFVFWTQPTLILSIAISSYHININNAPFKMVRYILWALAWPWNNEPISIRIRIFRIYRFMYGTETMLVIAAWQLVSIVTSSVSGWFHPICSNFYYAAKNNLGERRNNKFHFSFFSRWLNDVHWRYERIFSIVWRDTFHCNFPWFLYLLLFQWTKNSNFANVKDGFNRLAFSH